MSLNPSPNKFIEITVTIIAIPGKVASHHALLKKSRDSARSNPHSGVGGLAPIPKKLSEAPAKIAVATSNVANTRIDAKILGMICTITIRALVNPNDLAATI